MTGWEITHEAKQVGQAVLQGHMHNIVVSADLCLFAQFQHGFLRHWAHRSRMCHRCKIRHSHLHEGKDPPEQLHELSCGLVFGMI